MILHGHLLTDPTRTPPPGWLRVDDAGRIAELGEGAPPESPDAGGGDAILSPAFIDAHMHLPQIDAVGVDGLDLLDWLDEAVYPAEARWADPAVAARQIRDAFRRMAACGTLGFCGYGSSHPHTLRAAVEAAREIPLRAVVGQVLMDRHAPAALLGQPIADLDAPPDSTVLPSVNPRFAISCSGDLLRAAAERAAAGSAFIQTHLAETRAECARVADLFPDAPDYTGVYEHHGLLGPRSIFAHGVHLGDDEWQRLAASGSIIAHCPAANTFLQAGLFDLRAAREHGVRLAIGSDVAAGPDLAMPRIARAMIEVAKVRRLTIDPRAHVPTPAEAWHAITAGNAAALGWTDTGALEVGHRADVLILRPPFEIDEHLPGRLIYTWRDEYITDRLIAGVRLAV